MKELTSETLRDKVEKLLADEHIRENCMRISQEMRSSANLDQTAEKLVKYAEYTKGRISNY